MHIRLCHWCMAVALLLVHGLAPARAWQPAPGKVEIPLWPHAVPDALRHPKPESVGTGEGRYPWTKVSDVSRPTMTVYAPKGHNTVAAVLVFPGGGYQVLAMDLEGT